MSKKIQILIIKTLSILIALSTIVIIIVQFVENDRRKIDAEFASIQAADSYQTGGVRANNTQYKNVFSLTETNADYEKWGLSIGSGDELYFGQRQGTSYNSASDEVILTGYRFNVNSVIYLKVQDYVTKTATSTTFKVTGLAGAPFDGTSGMSTVGTFSYNDLSAPEISCKEIYGFSSNNFMTELPYRTFYNCTNLRSVHLGRSITDKLTTSTVQTLRFGCAPNLKWDQITVDPNNPNMKVAYSMVNGINGSAVIVNQNGSKHVYGNSLASGAINITELFDENTLITLPVSCFDSAFSITEVDLRNVKNVLNRCFFYALNIRNVYLYDNDYSTTRDGTGMYWEVYQTSSGEFGYQRAQFANYDPTIVSRPDVLNAKTIIHMMPGATEAQLATYRSHHGDLKLGDTDGVFGLQSEDQIVVDNEITQIQIKGPDSVSAYPGQQMNNWSIDATPDTTTIPRNYLWSIDSPLFEINQYSGLITVPTTTAPGTYNVVLSAQVAYNSVITDTHDLQIVVEGSADESYYYLSGSLSLDTDVFGGGSTTYYVNTNDPSIEDVEWALVFADGSPTTDKIHVLPNPDDVFGVTLYVEPGCEPAEYTLSIEATGYDDEHAEVYQTSIDVVVVVEGPSIDLYAPITYHESYQNSGTITLSGYQAEIIGPDAIYANDYIDWSFVTSNQVFTNHVQIIKSGVRNNNCDIIINTDGLEYGNYNIQLTAFDASYLTIKKTVDVRIAILANDIVINGDHDAWFSYYQGGSTLPLVATLNGHVVIPTWTITNSTQFNIGSDGSIVVPADLLVGTYPLNIHAGYGDYESLNDFIVTIHVNNPTISLTGPLNVSFFENTAGQVANFTSVISMPNNTVLSDHSKTWTLSGDGASNFALSPNPNDNTQGILTLTNLALDDGAHFNLVITVAANALALPNGTKLTNTLPIDVRISEISYSMEYTTTATGLNGYYLDGVQKVPKTIAIATSCNASPTDTYVYTYTVAASVSYDSADLFTGPMGEIRINPNLAVGQYYIEVTATGVTQPSHVTSSSFNINQHASMIDITTNDTNSFTDGVGGTMQFNAVVQPIFNATNTPYGLSQSVTWSLTGSGASQLQLDNNGLLTVPKTIHSYQELAITINVKANDPSITAGVPLIASYSLIVYINDPIITVYMPENDTINWYRGMTGYAFRFTAMISPSELSQTIRWEIDPLSPDYDLLNNQVYINATTGYLSIYKGIPLGNHTLNIKAIMVDDDHVIKAFPVHFNITLPFLEIRGIRKIEIDHNDMYEEFKYLPRTNYDYYGEITWSLPAELTDLIVFYPDGSLGIIISKFGINDKIIIPLVASTADGEVIAIENLEIYFPERTTLNGSLFFISIIPGLGIILFYGVLFTFKIFHHKKNKEKLKQQAKSQYRYHAINRKKVIEKIHKISEASHKRKMHKRE